MDTLGFKIELRPHGPGNEVAWLIDDAGRQRRASAEELALWQALQAADGSLREIWGTVCPDCGPGDYAGIAAEVAARGAKGRKK